MLEVNRYLKLNSYVNRVLRMSRMLEKELKYIFPVTRPQKILFDHLPKCGGTSVNAFILGHYPKRKVFSINGRNPIESISEFKKMSQFDRYKYDYVQGHGAHALLDYVHPEFIKVTMLREPIDRIVSLYYYIRRTKTHFLYSDVYETNMSLGEFAASGLSEWISNFYTTYFSGLTLDDVKENEEEAVTKAYNSIMERYDIIGFLDNSSFFIQKIASRGGLMPLNHLARTNRTEGRPEVCNLENEVIQQIKQSNYLDIVLYRKIKDAVG